MRHRLSGLRLFAVCVIAAVVLSGCGGGFDASGYVQAVLDLTFQGDPSRALEVMEGSTEESLMKQYQASVDNFVADNITSEIDMSEIKTQDFTELVARIFATMRYDVGKARKTGSREYEVPVDIQPSDVFVHFQQSLAEDSKKITEKVKDGGYEGTDEEVTKQILSDIVNRSYALMDSAYSDTQYGKTQTVILKVKADKNNRYIIDQDDMNQLFVKILRLDEIQG